VNLSSGIAGILMLKMISVSQNDKNIEEILDEVFKGTDIKYEVYNRQIALYKVTKPDFSLMVQQPVTREITGTSKRY
jgi:hypothetical protein